MKKACVQCSKSSGLLEIPGKDTLYICLSCVNSAKSSAKLTDHVWEKQEIDSSNCVCKLCFLSPPSFINITTNPLEKICYQCASQTTKTGSKMFINIKWQSIVKASEDINKYEIIKENLQAMRKGSEKMLSSIAKSKNKTIELKKTIVNRIEDYFTSQVQEIDAYSSKIAKFNQSLIAEAKADIFSGTISHSRSKGTQLLKSERNRRLLYDKAIITEAYKTDPLYASFQNLCTISCVPTEDLVFDESIILFIARIPQIIQVFLDTCTFERLDIGLEVSPWKHQASWCVYENGDFLYAGGEINEKLSPEVFFITNNREIRQVKSFTAKKTHCLVLFDGLVYSLGGSSDVCERYARNVDYWERIANTPESLGPSSACITDDKIVVASFKRSYLFYYSPANNQFVKGTEEPFKSNTSKLILRWKNSLFCLNKNCVYVSDLSAKNWQKVNVLSEEKEWCSLCTPHVVDKEIFFVLDDFSVYGFSIINHSVRRLKLGNNKA
jgi:hypothetical protein